MQHLYLSNVGHYIPISIDDDYSTLHSYKHKLSMTLSSFIVYHYLLVVIDCCRLVCCVVLCCAQIAHSLCSICWICFLYFWCVANYMMVDYETRAVNLTVNYHQHTTTNRSIGKRKPLYLN